MHIALMKSYDGAKLITNTHTYIYIYIYWYAIHKQNAALNWLYMYSLDQLPEKTLNVLLMELLLRFSADQLCLIIQLCG